MSLGLLLLPDRKVFEEDLEEDCLIECCCWAGPRVLGGELLMACSISFCLFSLFSNRRTGIGTALVVYNLWKTRLVALDAYLDLI